MQTEEQKAKAAATVITVRSVEGKPNAVRLSMTGAVTGPDREMAREHAKVLVAHMAEGGVQVVDLAKL